MSDYSGVSFWDFFVVLFQRIKSLQCLNPEADELQLALLSLLSIGCGLLSPFLVLKRMTMFVNALSHTILLGVIGSFLISSFLWKAALFDSTTLFLGAMIASFCTALMNHWMIRFFRLEQETTVAIVFSSLFALGVISATIFTKNAHLGIESVMGNIDLIDLADVKRIFFWVVIILLGMILFYRKLQMISFDAAFAKTIGLHPQRYQFLLLFLTAGISVFAFRAVGVLLVLSFLTGPYLIARLFSHKLSNILIISSSAAFLVSWIAVALSRHLLSEYQIALSTAGIVVALMAVVYFSLQFFFLLYKNRRSS